jgi:hypothetical protein
MTKHLLVSPPMPTLLSERQEFAQRRARFANLCLEVMTGSLSHEDDQHWAAINHWLEIGPELEKLVAKIDPSTPRTKPTLRAENSAEILTAIAWLAIECRIPHRQRNRKSLFRSGARIDFGEMPRGYVHSQQKGSGVSARRSPKNCIERFSTSRRGFASG